LTYKDDFRVAFIQLLIIYNVFCTQLKCFIVEISIPTARTFSTVTIDGSIKINKGMFNFQPISVKETKSKTSLSHLTVLNTRMIFGVLGL